MPQFAKFNGNDIFFVDNRHIWQNYINLHFNLMEQVKGDMSRYLDFLAAQDRWTRSMIESHPSDEDAYWRHVSYVMAQLDGLHAGYSAAALPEWVTNYNHYNVVTYCGRER